MLTVAMLLILPLSGACAAGVPAAQAASDIQHHWAADTILRWADQGWLPDTIRPDDHVTRAEFAAFANQAMRLTTAADALPFTDITPEHWAHQEIAIAYHAGYMSGNASGQAQPDRYTTRQEVAAMLHRIIRPASSPPLDPALFADSDTIADWARPAVSALADAHILRGDTQGNFRPLSYMTRAEAMVAVDVAARYLASVDTSSSPIVSRLKVSDNGRILTNADGSPFFWLGDTAWELAHRADRREIHTYLQSASDYGYNVVQTVALAELRGLHAPNAYGDLPLIDQDPSKPAMTAGNNPQLSSEYDYWDHVDYLIETAESYGIYIALLPSWGSYLWENRGQRAEPIFDSDNAYDYGFWLGQRYGEKDNIIWVLGGDRIPDSPDKLMIIRNMANGLNDGGGSQLKTYHPWGGKSSSEYFHQDDWLDFNSYQSGHPARNYENDRFTAADYRRSTVKPTIDLEPRYEHLPIDFELDNGRFDGYDARQAAYWSVFAGAFGHTYGHNSIWQLYASHREPALDAAIPWTEAIHAEGRTSLKWLRQLIESRPMLARVPDSSMIVDARAGASKITATRGENYAFIYSSMGEPFEVKLGVLSGDTVRAHWYDPRTGEATWLADYRNTGTQLFTPPSAGRDHDWVLMLDEVS